MVGWKASRDNLSVREATRRRLQFLGVADVAARSRHVRFTPDSGHSSEI
jgi:hypothetical protein